MTERDSTAPLGQPGGAEVEDEMAMFWRGASNQEPTAGEIINSIAAKRLSVELWASRGKIDVAASAKRSLAVAERSATLAKCMPTEEASRARMAELRELKRDLE